MCEDIKNLKICLTIDKNTIYEFDEKINEQSIIESAKHIEQLLIEHNAKSSKIQNVFELSVEVMQNILNYSYGNKDLPNNKKEAVGVLTLSYSSSDDIYTLQSCNLIDKNQEDIIKSKLQEVEGLDNSALRKLSREKMRSRDGNHAKGAGLGFIMMAKKCCEPISVDFKGFKDDIVQYKLVLKI